MTEAYGPMPSRVGFIMAIGKRAGGFALTPMVERFGQKGAQRNAGRAALSHCADTAAGVLAGCARPWQPEAIDHIAATTEDDIKPALLDFVAEEKQAVPRLESSLARLEEAIASEDPGPVNTLIQNTRELIDKVGFVPVPQPRQPGD